MYCFMSVAEINKHFWGIIVLLKGIKGSHRPNDGNIFDLLGAQEPFLHLETIQLDNQFIDFSCL